MRAVFADSIDSKLLRLVGTPERTQLQPVRNFTFSVGRFEFSLKADREGKGYTFSNETLAGESRSKSLNYLIQSFSSGSWELLSSFEEISVPGMSAGLLCRQKLYLSSEAYLSVSISLSSSRDKNIKLQQFGGGQLSADGQFQIGEDSLTYFFADHSHEFDVMAESEGQPSYKLEFPLTSSIMEEENSDRYLDASDLYLARFINRNGSKNLLVTSSHVLACGIAKPLTADLDIDESREYEDFLLYAEELIARCAPTSVLIGM